MVAAMFWLFRKTPRRRCNEEIDLLIDIVGQNAFTIQFLKETNMAITQQIQDALDRIHQTQSLAQSLKQASDLQTAQISTLTDKVTQLQAKLDAGGQIGPDDLGALAEITGDIDQVNAQLQSAIPANTGAGGAVNAGQGTPQSNAPIDPQQAPQGSDAGAATDASKPQPLAGTGAPSA